MAEVIITCLGVLLIFSSIDRRALRREKKEASDGWRQAERSKAATSTRLAEVQVAISDLRKAFADERAHLLKTIEHYTEMEKVRWNDLTALKRDGFVKPPPVQAVGPRAPEEPMHKDVQELLGKYPSELRSSTAQWIRDQRRLGAEWERIVAHLRGDGQGWKRADDVTREAKS